MGKNSSTSSHNKSYELINLVDAYNFKNQDHSDVIKIFNALKKKQKVDVSDIDKVVSKYLVESKNAKDHHLVLLVLDFASKKDLELVRPYRDRIRAHASIFRRVLPLTHCTDDDIRVAQLASGICERLNGPFRPTGQHSRFCGDKSAPMVF